MGVVRSGLMHLAAVAVVAMGAALGCGGSPPDGAPQSGPKRIDAAGPSRRPSPGARGIDRSNEAEVEALLRETLPRPRTTAAVRCRVARQLSESTDRYACTAGAKRYLVDWEHYGTGAYVISGVGRDGRRRRLARGVLSIGE